MNPNPKKSAPSRTAKGGVKKVKCWAFRHQDCRLGKKMSWRWDCTRDKDVMLDWKINGECEVFQATLLIHPKKGKKV